MADSLLISLDHRFPVKIGGGGRHNHRMIHNGQTYCNGCFDKCPPQPPRNCTDKQVIQKTRHWTPIMIHGNLPAFMDPSPRIKKPDCKKMPGMCCAPLRGNAQRSGRPLALYYISRTGGALACRARRACAGHFVFYPCPSGDLLGGALSAVQLFGHVAILEPHTL